MELLGNTQVSIKTLHKNDNICTIPIITIKANAKSNLTLFSKQAVKRPKNTVDKVVVILSKNEYKIVIIK